MARRILCFLLGHQFTPVSDWLGDPKVKIRRLFFCQRCYHNLNYSIDVEEE